MKKKLKIVVLLLIVTIFSVFWNSYGISQWKPLIYLENLMSDTVYRRPVGSSQNIKIIGVDEETLSKYGKFEEWSREKLAELVELLSSDEEIAPAVICMDFFLMGKSDSKPEKDARLVEAVQNAGNVVFASNLVYRTAYGQDENGVFYRDEQNIQQVEKPFDALRSVSKYGYANTMIESDGYIRRSRVNVLAENEMQNSLAYQAYMAYQASKGEEAKEINGLIQFQYSGNPGDYEKVSLVDVLEGRMDLRAFKDCIVMVGAYAPGMQDSFHVAVDRGELMYGVEVHANIIDSLLDGKIVRDVPKLLSTVITVLVLAVYSFVAQRQKKLFMILSEGVFVMLLWLGAGIVLKKFLWILPLSGVEIGMVLLMTYFIVTKYVFEKLEKKRVLKAFERYVAPEIVKELGKDDAFCLHCR